MAALGACRTRDDSAADRLGFTQVNSLVSSFIEFGGDVFPGGSIFVREFWLAKSACRTVTRGNGEQISGLA
jgi:hypothetical protein